MIVKIGTPPFPAIRFEDDADAAKILYVAKLKHVWSAATRYVKQNGCEIEDIAPTEKYYIPTWFETLEVSHGGVINLYQIEDHHATWMVEWMPPA